LGVEFTQFKFLFYEEEKSILENNHQIYRFEEITSFSSIKNKTELICSKSYKELEIYSYKFGLKNISNICLDCTFFIFYLEKLGIKNSSYLKMKSHKINGRQLKKRHLDIIAFNLQNFNIFLGKEKNFTIFIIFIIGLIFLAIYKNLRFCFKNHIISGFYKLDNFLENQKYSNLDDDIYYRRLLDFYKVKNCLLYKENALMKEKYGKDFDCDLISEDVLLEDFKFFLNTSEEMKTAVMEVKLNIAEMKFSAMENMILFFCYLIIIISYIYLLFNIYHFAGLMFFLMTNLIFFSNIMIFYLLKKAYCYYFVSKKMDFNFN
jgi:hypothetical protein